jgi:hypothetical protein
VAALARELALELVPQMKVPQWDLVDVNSLELYEALDKQFPKPAAPQRRPGGGGVVGQFFRNLLRGGGDDQGDKEVGAAIENGDDDDDAEAFVSPPINQYERRTARERYLIGLIVAARTDDAVPLTREIAADEGDRAISLS